MRSRATIPTRHDAHQVARAVEAAPRAPVALRANRQHVAPRRRARQVARPAAQRRKQLHVVPGKDHKVVAVPQRHRQRHRRCSTRRRARIGATAHAAHAAHTAGAARAARAAGHEVQRCARVGGLAVGVDAPRERDTVAVHCDELGVVRGTATAVEREHDVDAVPRLLERRREHRVVRARHLPLLRDAERVAAPAVQLAAQHERHRERAARARPRRDAAGARRRRAARVGRRPVALAAQLGLGRELHERRSWPLTQPVGEVARRLLLQHRAWRAVAAAAEHALLPNSRVAEG